MLHQTPIRLALIALIAATPAPGWIDAAHAGSSSRADTRHNLAEDEAAEVKSTRSAKRRATRSSGASEETQVTQNRGKRSRRAPGKAEDAPAMIATAQTVETDFVALAQTKSDDIAKHIRTGDFEGTTGVLALYQLTGKAAAQMPLTPVEMRALGDLTEDTDLATIIEKTEAQLMDASGDPTMLDAVAEALGIPRPVDVPAGRVNLGAYLATEAASNG